MAKSRITANDLRFAGEEADSIRGESGFLVLDDKGIPHVVSRSQLENRQPLLELFTEPRGDGMKADVKVKLLLKGKPITKPIPHLEEADAVFLTQSAVAKFILPYYMRFKTGNQVGALENSLFNPANVVAAIHIPGSLTFAVQPKVGIVTLNPDTGECDCRLLPVDDDNPPDGSASKAATSKSSARKKPAGHAKHPHKR